MYLRYYNMLTDAHVQIINYNNKYLYSASSCVTQSAVTHNEWNAINKRREMLEFEVKKLLIVLK